MLAQIRLNRVLFIDIETVARVADYQQLDERTKELWAKKMNYYVNNDLSAEDLYERAGIYAEFGKVICISVGKITTTSAEPGMKICSFYGDDEKTVLQQFAEFLYKLPYDLILCAHNGKEFDFPYLIRRMLINSIKLPEQLDLSGKKPWEVNHLDTMELWKFGDYKHYTSLDLLASVFNIPTPKEDLSGADVGKVYWKEGDLERIVRYCRKDVVTVAQLLIRFKGDNLIKEENIYYV